MGFESFYKYFQLDSCFLYFKDTNPRLILLLK